MFYILYQVTNNLNGKIYVGVHKTRDMNDGYMGSGKVIARAIKKYGIENFTKVILEQFEDATAMYAREKEVVTEEFLLREDVYNLRRGGSGGFDFINKHEMGIPHITIETAKEYSIRGAAVLKIKKQDPEFYAKHLEACRKGGRNSPRFIKHSKSSIEKIKIACQGKQVGDKNSQFGKMWITNEITSIKILKSDIIPVGWRKGRVMNMEG
jgi:hypothetical protein